MNKNSTLTGKFILILAILALSAPLVKAQTSPQLKFRQPHLIAGVDGQIGATYKFSNVIPGINASVKIVNIVNGAVLRNIDDSTLGYYNAWQPTVGGPGTYGSSYIKWKITFDSAGIIYKFTTLNASAIDVDGDNVRVREFIGVNGQSSYNIPTQVPSLLTITKVLDTDNIGGTDISDSNLIALGPVVNRTGIDTLSQDVRINFNFSSTTGFEIYTGSEVDNNGNTGAIATDRYHCIYFQNIVGSFNVLPITYQSFNAVLDNGAVDLGWTTGVEFLNDHFEVERSFDQTTFTAIGIVLGAQSVNNGVCQYNFQDKDDQISTQKLIYYRLKQVSTNNKVSYSAIKVIQVNNSTANKIAIQAMPNPYMDQLNVSFDSQQEGKAEMVMISASGTIVKKIQANLVKGFNNFALEDLSGQRAGLYVVTILVNGQSVGSRKIIKN
jgi:hypothetical protein